MKTRLALRSSAFVSLIALVAACGGDGAQSEDNNLVDSPSLRHREAIAQCDAEFSVAAETDGLRTRAAAETWQSCLVSANSSLLSHLPNIRVEAGVSASGHVDLHTAIGNYRSQSEATCGVAFETGENGIALSAQCHASREHDLALIMDAYIKVEGKVYKLIRPDEPGCRQDYVDSMHDAKQQLDASAWAKANAQLAKCSATKAADHVTEAAKDVQAALQRFEDSLKSLIDSTSLVCDVLVAASASASLSVDGEGAQVDVDVAVSVDAEISAECRLDASFLVSADPTQTPEPVVLDER